MALVCRSSQAGRLPSAPAGLVSIGASAGVALDWLANPVGEQVTSYNVYRATNEGGPYTLKASPIVTNYTDTTAASGILYWYRVTAVNSFGEGAYSAVQGGFTADVTPPGVPTGLTATQTGASSVLLDWVAPTDADLAGFNVYSSLTIGSGYTKLNVSGLVVPPTYLDTAASPGGGLGRTWYYRVTAVDLAGNEGTYASTSIFIASPDTIPPATPPAPVAVDRQDAGIFVSWTPNTETDLAGYNIYRSDDSYTTALNGGVLLNTASYSDTSAVVGTPYTYKVKAYDTTTNGSNLSPASNSATRTGTTTFDLTAFIKVGEMVPCVCHARGVTDGKYVKVDDNVAHVANVTWTESNDFPALTAGTVLTADYLWNMAAGTNNPQGLYPTAKGFNYAHAYDAAGTYTVKLTRKEENGITKVYQCNITVAADTRRKIYVSSNGDSSSTNDGSSQSSPVSVDRANAIISTTTNCKVILRSGDRFERTTKFFQIQKKNIWITSISTFNLNGSTAKPILSWSATSTAYRWMMGISSGGTNAVVENLAFDVSYGSLANGRDKPISISGQTNVLIRNNDIIRAGELADMDDGNSCQYLLIQGNQSKTVNSMSDYLSFVEGQDVVIIGNLVHNVLNSHPVRVSEATRVNISYNDFTNLGYDANVVPNNQILDTADSVRTVLDLQQGGYWYVYNNKMTTWSGHNEIAGEVQIGPLQYGTGKMGEYCKWIVLDRNLINSMVSCEAGSYQVMVKNNIIIKPAGYPFEIWGHGQGLDFWGNDMHPRTQTDLFIYNNTIINTGTSGQNIRVIAATDRMYLKNNLVVAGSQTVATGNYEMYIGSFDAVNLPMYIDRQVFATFDSYYFSGSTIGLATLNTKTNITNNVAAAVVLDSNYKVPVLSVAKTQGRPVVGVYEDYYGTVRNRFDANWTCGAVQSTY